MYNVKKEDLDLIYDKFITDPDWKIVTTLIEQFIEPLKSIESIDTEGKTSDEVFAQLKGQKTAIDAMEKFLDETRLIQQNLKQQDTDWR